MMREFSDRTATGLKEYKLFKLILPPFKSFLEINLEKEIDKHQDVIACAMAAVRAGQAPDHTDTDRLLRRAREIDQAFLHKAHSLSAAINIDYPAIDRVRQRRIELVIATAYQVLAQWQGKTPLRKIVSGLYTREQYRSLLREILSLYIEETGVLSKSVKIPRHLARFRDSLIN
ncbi:MAG: hypothetical protein HW386_2103, partial [Gammaproteobacteria bacterium]|nr:hypothetical protein [Gammaproteobacteria bacterium]